MESTRYTEIAALENVENSFKFCREYVIPSNDFKGCGEVDLHH